MNPFSAVLASCLLVATAGDGPAHSAPKPVGHRVVEPFDYRGVTLDAGPLKTQVDEVRAYYLAIADDDLLKGFRTRAGKPASGKDLGGWYSSDTFLVFGQIVSGLARLHAATGDPECRNKANRLIEEWAKCIEPDGYFYASRNPNAPHYISGDGRQAQPRNPPPCLRVLAAERVLCQRGLRSRRAIAALGPVAGEAR